MKNILGIMITLAFTACGDSSSSGGAGADKVVSQCLAFGNAVKIAGGFRYNVVNTCNKKINVLESSTSQRFALDKNENQDVVLFSQKPSMGACFDPFRPETKDNSGKFECKD